MKHQLKCSASLLALSAALVLAFSVMNEGRAQGMSFESILNQLDEIGTQLDEIGGQLDLVTDGYIPYATLISAGNCNTAVDGSSNPEIQITTDGSDPFIVTVSLSKERL